MLTGSSWLDMSYSVVIPVHNRAKCLNRALDSVFAQSRPPDEVLIVDDASVVAVESQMSLPGNARVLRNEQNRGAAFSRNRGAKEVRSHWVAFLDSDDFWAPSKMEKQLAIGEKSEAGLVYCDQIVVLPDASERSSGKRLVNSELISHLINFWTPPNTSTLVFDRKFFLDLGGFDESLPSCQDHDLWFRVARSGVDVSFVEEPLSYFSQQESERISNNMAARIAGVEFFLRKWKGDISKVAGSQAYRRFRNLYYFNAMVPVLRRSLLKKPISSMRFFTRYLAWNPVFYNRLLRKLFMNPSI